MPLGLPIYPGTAVNTALGDEEIPGMIALQPDSLLFHTEANDVQCVLPFERVQFTLLASKQVRLTDPEQPDWEVYTADDRLLSHPLIRRHGRTRLKVKEIEAQREGRNRLKWTGVFLGVVGILVIAAWLLTGQVINLVVKHVPHRWEQGLDEKALVELRQSPSQVREIAWPEGVNEIVDRLSQARPPENRHFKLLLLEDPEPNARALPGGTIVVHSGLFDLVKTPEEFAGVLAHEMAHVHCRHGLKILISAIGPYYALKLFIGDRNRLAESLGAHTALLLASNYSRENEFEADTLAWRRLVSANVDPRGFISILKKLDEAERKSLSAAVRKILAKSGEAKQAANPYASHPEMAERIARLERLWSQSPKKTGFATLSALEWQWKSGNVQRSKP